MRPNLRHVLLVLGLPPLLAACAAAPADARGGEMRVLVKATRADADGAAIAALASRSSGAPVRHVAASGGGWHALAIDCRSERDCDAALQRLIADTANFESAQKDGRKKIVSPQ